MGAIAEALVAYAQPLIDQTDGSFEQLNKAFAITQLCYNLALMPEESRDQTLSEMRLSLEMDAEEFDDFRRSIILPMLRRHQEMFPRIDKMFPQIDPLGSTDSSASSPNRPLPGERPGMAARAEAYPGTERYAPCPCNSGRKYKFCCGKKGL